MTNHLDTVFSPSLYLDRDKKAFQFIKDRLLHQEPCATASMYGNGKDYLFTNLVKEFESTTIPYNLKVLNTISEDELKDFADMLERETEPTLCMINLRIRKDVSWFVQRLSKLRFKRNYAFVCYVNSYFGDVYEALTQMDNPFISSLFVQELVGYEDALHIVDELSERFGFFPNQEQKKDIYQWTYGHVGLLRTLYLLKRDNPEKLFTKDFLLHEPSVLERLVNILSDIPSEKLQPLLQKKLSFADSMFFQRFGYINTEGELFHPLLKFLIPKENKASTSSLSPTEIAVLDYLSSHPDSVVSREDIAKIVWGQEEWEDKYSDWAIGQLIYRLRKKLEYATSSGTIKTKKGKGFVYLHKSLQ